MTKVDAQEYTESLGQIIGGSWRQVHLARKLGVPAALGLSTEQWVSSLGGYVRLEASERREAVLELKAEGLSQRETAEVLGVDQKTVSNDMRFEEFSSKPSLVPEEVIPELEENSSPPPKAHVSQNTGEIEWYTPAQYIEAARVVMGGIDLDPASSEEANQVVKAAQFFDAQSDGLAQTWKGRLWMNPPYAAVTHFCQKFLNSPEVSEAIILTNNATDTQWFHLLAGRVDAICFHLGRIKFWRPGVQSFTPLQGQVFFYSGPQFTAFRKSFLQFGLVARV